MRYESTVVSVSWIPSESVTGSLRRGFDLGLTHYDEPPPDAVTGTAELRRLRDADGFRFANVLSAWVEVEDGRVVAAGLGPEAGILMGATTVRVAQVGATFPACAMPALQPAPEQLGDRARFVQTVGGRTAAPLPRPVPHPPFVRWQAPLVWTTLALTVHADGRSEVELVGASAFPRHWVYGPDGRLALKSGVTDPARWMAHSFGARTPWSDREHPAVVAGVETALERELSALIMRGGQKPAVRRLDAGAVVTRQGEPGTELFLLLDGVLAVEVDGRAVAEVGPGAIVGERALLEAGARTATLVAVTPVRLAVAPLAAIDPERLAELATGHRREHDGSTELSR